MLPPMSLLRSSIRFFRQHPWQFWLTLLSIALGTAVMIAVDLANHSARQSFANSIDNVSGKMTHHIVANSGQGVPDIVYANLRLAGMRQTAAMIEGDVVIAGEVFQVIGIDPFAEPLFDQQSGVSIEPMLMLQLLTEPSAVLMAERTRQRLGFSLSSELALSVNGKQSSVMLQGVFTSTNQAVMDNVLFTDIANAQQLLRKTGFLDRIELILTEEQIPSMAQQLPQSVKLITSPTKTQALDQMTKAFRTNLTAMSLLAVLVGAFLVYNTMTFSVLQRRKQFAVERLIGVTQRDLFLQMLIEAVLIGLVGALLGVFLGALLGQALLMLVMQTIDDIFRSTDQVAFSINVWSVVKGLGITLSAVILATLVPAWEAAKTQPVHVTRASMLEGRFNQVLKPLFFIGALMGLFAFVVLVVFQRSLIGGFFALFLMVIAYSLWIPSLTVAALAILRPWWEKMGTLPAMVLRAVHSSLSRMNIAIIALAIAVSATVGVGIMIGSFRASVADWLAMTLQSDLYISSVNDAESRVEGKLPESWLSKAQKLPGVESVSSGYSTYVEVEQVPTPLLVLNPGEHGKQGFRFLEGGGEELWQDYMAGEVIFISEPLAYHHDLNVGDRLLTKNEQGVSVSAMIGGIYQDYSATQGMLVMAPGFYEKHWRDRGISSIGLKLTASADGDQVRQALRALTEGASTAIRIRSNKEIREVSLAIFDRTFAITNVLRLLVIIVAFVGVFSALMAVLLEKTREFSVLRATGMTSTQLAKMILMQTLLIGFLAGLFALPLGWAMSELLIHVINQRSFGWTMERVFSGWVIFEAIGLSMLAALLAGIYPMYRMKKLIIREGLSA
ncbi:MAG: AttF component of AttEFGH ABC transport system / AttG component of AttEFGH ABC transport system [uncultured Thiotrichaceae bacterium]|uniref:AttF component of AttEFGH ABC transport system / AttG component of AttEFGH ABC transport system n=1 Tax=uncultured Thiotrichaceae bacterium TaxID=298394 RepID=A0A6S6T8S5_9GAMM|nr:MAG: AttF component of AttEFGH ABC transport system / AttG component of AttEFGH ABC transport system [uncultured Thiotrichaceae bacterium]